MWVFNFFKLTRNKYQAINPLINADNVKDQAANYWMDNIRNFGFIHNLSSLGHTQTMLSFVADALAAPGVQENKIHLETLYGYLAQIQDRISYYASNNSDGFYKRFFWATSSTQLTELANQTQRYLEQVADFQAQIARNEGADYQRASCRRGADAVV